MLTDVSMTPCHCPCFNDSMLFKKKAAVFFFMPFIDNYFFSFPLEDAEDDEVDLAEMGKRPNNFC